MASSYAPNVYGTSLSDAFALDLKKKLPALTISQARQLVAPTISKKTRHPEDGLPSINYHQQRNYLAYCSHRKHNLNQRRAKVTKGARRKTS